MMCASKEIRAVLIVCFESIAHEQRNNVCDVTCDTAIRSYICMCVANHTFVAISYIASTFMCM